MKLNQREKDVMAEMYMRDLSTKEIEGDLLLAAVSRLLGTIDCDKNPEKIFDILYQYVKQMRANK